MPECFFWKEHGGLYGTEGIPDLIVCYKGRFVSFEVKTATGKVSVLQQVTINRIRAAGGIAEIVRSVDEARAVLAKL
jgi:hypothetical protein